MARQSSRKLWTAHLAGGAAAAGGNKRKAAAAYPSGEKLSGAVLGIDPSLRGTGLAVFSFDRGEPVSLDFHRTLKLASTIDLPGCLGQIYMAVSEALRDHAVEHVAIEQTIYVQNFQTAQILGAARGAAIAAAAVAGKPVFEYAPLRMKQAVVGFGRATKEQVGRTLMQRIGRSDSLPPDEADAAGVAVCHALLWRKPVD